MRASPLTGTLSDSLPRLDLPYDTGTGLGLIGDRGAAVFVHFDARTEVAIHSHGPQWGAILTGEMALVVDGIERVVRAGDWYDIPAGAMHGGVVEAGTTIIDFFSEPDRFRVLDD